MEVEDAAHARLRLDDLPPIFVLPTHMDEDEMHEVEDRLIEFDAPLTYDASEARIFIGKIQQPRRAAMELRSRGLHTESIEMAPRHSVPPTCIRAVTGTKRRRRSSGSTAEGSKASGGDSSTESEPEQDLNEPSVKAQGLESKQSGEALFRVEDMQDAVWVIKVAWLENAIRTKTKHALYPFAVYAGKVTSASKPPSALPASASATVPSTTTNSKDILSRAQSDINAPNALRLDRKSRAWSTTTQQRTRHPNQTLHPAISHLKHQTTSEHDTDLTSSLPPPPTWVTQNLKYSCQRSSPSNPPNAPFINTLKTIRTARTLIDDQIGVRAYSTAIAALAAYPYTLTSAREILRLPGCSDKIAALFVEYTNNRGQTQAAVDATTDPRLKVLRLFYDIWGVGPHTARDFYNRGWRDLDDVTEFGWSDLSRVQQLGLKYYDEFQRLMSRTEVEAIDATIAAHTRRVISSRCGDPDGVRTCIVGGYRRGKSESGDADVIVSHFDDSCTLDLITALVASLHKAGWITHNLGTHTSGSRRGQAVLPWRGNSGQGGGHGFDTLDKAMVVWQDPTFDHDVVTERDSSGAKRNPNVHRRVDIIVAPWSRIGCAVLGWTAGTTFERDLRRYAKVVRGWKFDSSGIRERETGRVVDAEGGGVNGGRCKDVEAAERRVFKALGLEWREPWERCTG